MRKNILNNIGIFILSFIVFYVIGTIPLTIYVGILDALLTMVLIAYFKADNYELIKKVAVYVIVNISAYVAERVLTGTISSYAIRGRGVTSYICLVLLATLYVSLALV